MAKGLEGRVLSMVRKDAPASEVREVVKSACIRATSMAGGGYVADYVATRVNGLGLMSACELVAALGVFLNEHCPVDGE